MKKIIITIITFVTLLFIIGCGSEGEKTESAKKSDGTITEETPTNFVAAEVSKDESFDLSYLFPTGKKIKYKLTSVVTSNQKITADSTIENDVSQTTEYIFDLDAKQMDEEVSMIELNIESIKMNANYNGEIIKYDSKDINDEETNRRFAEYSSLPNNRFWATLNKEGRIIDIGKTEGIINRYLEIQQAQSITDDEKNQINLQLKEQVLQPISQNLFKYLPGRKTKLDSTWTLTYGTEMGLYKLTNIASSRISDILKENDDLIAKINTDLSVTYEGDGFIKQGDVSYQFEKPKISGNAISYFNLDEKIIVKSELTTTTEMNVFVTADNPNTGKETATRKDISVNKNYLELISVE